LQPLPDSAWDKGPILDGSGFRRVGLMEAKTRVRKAITYLNGALSYLECPTNEFSIKQAQAYLKNARTLLVRMKLGKSDTLLSDIRELLEASQ